MHAKVAILTGFLCLSAIIGGGMANAATASSGTDASSHGASALPAALRQALYEAFAHDAGPTYSIKRNGCAVLPKEKLQACFTAAGVRLTGTNAKSLALRLAAWGRGEALQPINAVTPKISGNQARYIHGNITEWWRVLPAGFEQGFTIKKRPGGNGELTLTLATNGKASVRDGTLRRTRRHRCKR